MLCHFRFRFIRADTPHLAVSVRHEFVYDSESQDSHAQTKYAQLQYCSVSMTIVACSTVYVYQDTEFSYFTGFI